MLKQVFIVKVERAIQSVLPEQGVVIPPVYCKTLKEQRMVKHIRSCKRNNERCFLSLNYNSEQLILLAKCSLTQRAERSAYKHQITISFT